MASHQDFSQAQMRRDDDMVNQPSDVHGQSNFLQETGNQVKNMTQGATDMGKEAIQGAVNIAKGAALGTSNIAQGAADAMKNTFGMNPDNSSGSTDNSSTTYTLLDGNTATTGDGITKHPGTINYVDSYPNTNTSVPRNTNYPGSTNYPTSGKNPLGN